MKSTRSRYKFFDEFKNIMQIHYGEISKEDELAIEMMLPSFYHYIQGAYGHNLIDVGSDATFIEVRKLIIKYFGEIPTAQWRTINLLIEATIHMVKFLNAKRR